MVRLAEQIGGGGQDETWHGVAHRSVDQCERPARVFLQIAHGLLHAFPYQGKGGEMDDRMPGAAGQHRIDLSSIGNIGDHKFHAGGDCCAMALAQVVHNGNGSPLLDQKVYHVAADIAGAAGDKKAFGQVCSMLQMRIRR